MPKLADLVPFASQRFPKLSSHVLASSGYTTDLSSFDDGFSDWTEHTAARQDAAWRPIVADSLKGNARADVASLHAALEAVGEPPDTVLECGCGGGYNSELIQAWYPSSSYVGIDLSSAMIAVATAHYPDRDFRIASAYELPLADAAVGVVVDGAALIHMPEWNRALSEYGRVARRSVVLHALTVTDDSPTTRFGKYAYGQPALELVFNRAELLAECSASGLELAGVYPGLEYDLTRYLGIKSTSEAWLLNVVG